jgi:hypothetical protein
MCIMMESLRTQQTVTILFHVFCQYTTFKIALIIYSIGLPYYLCNVGFKSSSELMLYDPNIPTLNKTF